MAKNYWFEPKRYGWGFTPTSMEGWLSTLILLILLLISLHTNGLFDSKVNGSNILRFLFDAFIISAVFTITMQGKVKGGLKWRWNGHKKKRRRKR